MTQARTISRRGIMRSPLRTVRFTVLLGPGHHDPQHEVDEDARERDREDRDDDVGDAEEGDFPAEVFGDARADAGDHLVARASQAASVGHAGFDGSYRAIVPAAIGARGPRSDARRP